MTPLKPTVIRIGKNEMYVDLRSEEVVEKALKKNRDCIGGITLKSCVDAHRG